MNINIDYDFFSGFIENIAKLVGKNCEIVVHDFSNGLDNTIVKIVNGHVSGRTVGNCPTSLFFEEYQEILKSKRDYSIYYNAMEDGRVFKSSTTFIRNGAGEIQGAVCVNFDITDLLQANSAMAEFIDYNPKAEGHNEELFVQNVGDLMEYYLSHVVETVGKSPEKMNKEERLRAIAYLDDKGVLQISKSSVKLCEFFGISKFTLYNDLVEIREGHKAEQEEKTNGKSASSM